MTDSLFDADRASGEYPPKGWGWSSDDEQRTMLIKLFESDEIEPWMFQEAQRLGLNLKSARLSTNGVLLK